MRHTLDVELKTLGTWTGARKTRYIRSWEGTRKEFERRTVDVAMHWK